MIMLHRLDVAEKSLAHYWTSSFRADLKRVLFAAPPRGGHDPFRTIQPWRLGPRNRVVRGWTRERRERFAIALYVMLRLDRFVAGYRSDRYEQFAERFEAPDFIGDCPGGCILALNPCDVLFCLGEDRRRWQDRAPVIPDRDLDPDVRAIARGVCEELLPDQDPDRFADAFEDDWMPLLLLDAIRNQAERNRRPDGGAATS